MRKDVQQAVDKAIEASTKAREALRDLSAIEPEGFTSYERETLISIADSLEQHIKNGQPYSLTFYYDKVEPLTPSQKIRLENYLAYHFRDIWGKTWIVGDARRIKSLIETGETDPRN